MVEIADEDDLLRRLAPLHLNHDGAVNSSAFRRGKVYDPTISVDLARLTTPQASVARAGKPDYRLGAIKAGDARGLGFAVRHDPIPGNNAHCLIEGTNDRAKSRQLAQFVRVLAGIVSQESDIE